MLRLCHLALFSGMLVNLCGCERGAPEGKDAPSSADTVSAADVPYPPEPDFENPVDYLAWFRERNFQEDWPAGIEVYAWAWSPEAGHEIPAPSDELKEQLVQAARAPWTTAEFPELPKYLTAVEPRLGLLQQAARVKDVQWLTDRSKEWCGMEWSLAKTTRWLMYGMMAKAWGPMTS